MNSAPPALTPPPALPTPPPPAAYPVQPQLTQKLSEATTTKLESSPVTPIPKFAPVTAQDSPVTVTLKPTESPPPDADVVYIPSYSRWFSWTDIHECEARFLPEFFDGKSPSKNPRVYKYYRNSIIKRFREIPTRKITFTEVRKTIIGDVGSIRRVFDFLDTWGLINYLPNSTAKLPLKWEDKESKSNAAPSQSTPEQGGAPAAAPAPLPADYAAQRKRFCSGCRTICTIACFSSDKHDLTLCARCYVRGNYRVGIHSNDFRRVEIHEEVKTDWSEKETLHLLEGIMHYGEDWAKVAGYVNGKSEKECVSHFIKLPFGQQFVGPPDCTEVDEKFDELKDQNGTEIRPHSSDTSSLTNKRMRLDPLADASNPILAQAAFLSALAGAEVAEVAARAAVRALADSSFEAKKDVLGFRSGPPKLQGPPDDASNGNTSVNTFEVARVNAQSEIEREEQDLEKAVSYIIDVKMKEIQDKMSHFEELELQMEKEWEQLQQIKNSLFADQLTLLFHRTAAARSAGQQQSTQQNVKAE